MSGSPAFADARPEGEGARIVHARRIVAGATVAGALLVNLTAAAASASAGTGRPDTRFVDAVPHAGGGSGRFVVPDAGGRSIQGIDVSHWQGAIDFALVKGARYRFVYMKATEGQTFDDPNYATYRVAAGGEGLLVGAYHFAGPDATADDAVLEADHFARVAAPRSGELVPVLDMETSGGLSIPDLQAWTQAWLDRATADLGVRPVIYTGPTFWRTSMGDTTMFADEGYRVVWVANWGVSRPDVPAHDWGGAGWTLWQWTNCGSVPGIAGCVDMDRLHKGRLQKVVIP
jgi:GH25 family lysozyme M1 (1,4-beta-N-acetylmuramidase)